MLHELRKVRGPQLRKLRCSEVSNLKVWKSLWPWRVQREEGHQLWWRFERYSSDSRWIESVKQQYVAKFIRSTWQMYQHCINFPLTFLPDLEHTDLEELTDLERFVQELEPVALASWKGLAWLGTGATFRMFWNVAGLRYVLWRIKDIAPHPRKHWSKSFKSPLGSAVRSGEQVLISVLFGTRVFSVCTKVRTASHQVVWRSKD